MFFVPLRLKPHYRDPLGLWSVTFGGYLGPGFEITFGVDHGIPFGTGRIGFGFGGGITWDPMGGIPGPSIKDPCKNGVVLSGSVAGNFSAGPLTGIVEVGDARNYSNKESDFYGSLSAGISNTFRGLNASISLGAQGTIYGGL